MNNRTFSQQLYTGLPFGDGQGLPGPQVNGSSFDARESPYGPSDPFELNNSFGVTANPNLSQV